MWQNPWLGINAVIFVCISNTPSVCSEFPENVSENKPEEIFYLVQSLSQNTFFSLLLTVSSYDLKVLIKTCIARRVVPAKSIYTLLFLKSKLYSRHKKKYCKTFFKIITKAFTHSPGRIRNSSQVLSVTEGEEMEVLTS